MREQEYRTNKTGRKLEIFYAIETPPEKKVNLGPRLTIDNNTVQRAAISRHRIADAKVNWKNDFFY